MIDGWSAGQSEREGGKLWRRDAAADAAGVRSSHRTEKVAPGMVWFGMVWLVWNGWYGMVRYGMVGMVLSAWYGWYGMADMVWYGWYGMVGMVWYVKYGMGGSVASLVGRA